MLGTAGRRRDGANVMQVDGGSNPGMMEMERPAQAESAQAIDVGLRSPIPFIKPEPPQLSQHLDRLQDLEASGVFSNYGPVNTRLEREFIAQMFGTGQCLTVCNATTGLMLAMHEVLGDARPDRRKYAIMPSFTFAAAAHAALWCGLIPLLCDVDPLTWLSSRESEEHLIAKYKDEIAVIMPVTTFGNSLDLPRYANLAEQHGIPIVVDAAGSLGCLDQTDRGFGSGFEWPVVFSMHATKPFSVGEAGLIYSADAKRIERLRAMASFGFEEARTASISGLNAKMSEVTALTALLQLERFPGIAARNELLGGLYRDLLDAQFEQQQQIGKRQIRAFYSTTLPTHSAGWRDAVVRGLREQGIGAATYFSPHIAQQPYFQPRVACGDLTETERLARSIVSLPLRSSMTEAEVCRVVETFHAVAEQE